MKKVLTTSKNITINHHEGKETNSMDKILTISSEKPNYYYDALIGEIKNVLGRHWPVFHIKQDSDYGISFRIVDINNDNDYLIERLVYPICKRWFRDISFNLSIKESPSEYTHLFSNFVTLWQDQTPADLNASDCFDTEGNFLNAVEETNFDFANACCTLVNLEEFLYGEEDKLEIQVYAVTESDCREALDNFLYGCSMNLEFYTLNDYNNPHRIRLGFI